MFVKAETAIISVSSIAMVQDVHLSQGLITRPERKAEENIFLVSSGFCFHTKPCTDLSHSLLKVLQAQNQGLQITVMLGTTTIAANGKCFG